MPSLATELATRDGAGPGRETLATTHSRRNLLLGLAAAGLGGKALAIVGKGRLSRRLGVQLYVLGQAPMPGRASAADLPRGLKALSDIGYREVEGAPPGVTAEAYRRELDRVDLVCPSIHVALEPSIFGALSLTDLPNVIAYAKIVGAKNLVVAAPPFGALLAKRPDAQALSGDIARLSAVLTSLVNAMSAADWIDIARQLNESGAKVAAAGLRIGYHNHNAEFATLANGARAYDLLMAHTDRRIVDFELDMGWARAAGLDPAALLKRYSGRITQLHLKELADTTANISGNLNSVDMGRGVQNWSAIVDAIRSSSVRHVYFEQEPPYPVSGIQSAAAAYAFLQPLLAKKGL